MTGTGKYEHYIEIWRTPNPETLDTFGASVSVPALRFASWGAFEPIGTREFPEAQKRHAETTARFRIPYPDYSFDPALDTIRLDFDDTTSPPTQSTWNIHGTVPTDGRRFELTIEVSQIL